MYAVSHIARRQHQVSMTRGRFNKNMMISRHGQWKEVPFCKLNHVLMQNMYLPNQTFQKSRRSSDRLIMDQQVSGQFIYIKILWIQKTWLFTKTIFKGTKPPAFTFPTTICEALWWSLWANGYRDIGVFHLSENDRPTRRLRPTGYLVCFQANWQGYISKDIKSHHV